ncbi:MAG TPA: transposase, partial [Candidatus Saccharimonadia bacterium]
QARQFVERLEIHYTPKHGSWLNIAEIELSALQSQCLKGRLIQTATELAHETGAWTKQRNENRATVNWQFTTSDARTKLARVL